MANLIKTPGEQAITQSAPDIVSTSTVAELEYIYNTRKIGTGSWLKRFGSLSLIAFALLRFHDILAPSGFLEGSSSSPGLSDHESGGADKTGSQYEED